MAKKNSRNRSAMIVAIAAIILIVIMGITAKNREELTFMEKWVGNIVTPLQKVINKGIMSVGNGFNSIRNFSTLKEENDQLKEQLVVLEKELVELKLSQDELKELRDLKYALNYIEYPENYDPVAADVVSKSPGNWFSTFIIDAGEKDGIQKDSIVLSANGLVGRIYEVGGNWSKVISIIDNNSSVSFQILRDSNYQGIISGSITNELTGYLFDPLADVVVGDKVITSGMGSYPPGILIGEIVDINKSDDQLLKTIRIEPTVNFKRITKVLVMKPKTVFSE